VAISGCHQRRDMTRHSREWMKQPLTPSSTLPILTNSALETRRLGRLLGELLHSGQTVALIGDLGAGKTCLTQGIARGLGVDEPVTSPTFIIVNEYKTDRGPTLYHIDCYRFADEGTQEAIAIGMDELLTGDGICVIEWAERIEPLLPEDRITISLRHNGPDSRALLFDAETGLVTALAQAFRAEAESSGMNLVLSTPDQAVPNERCC
jgi:tRNA threonylcarbamoyladenosine biosynthesis protein TsaE